MTDRDTLLQAFGIVAADLDANRAGRLGDTQRRSMLKSGTMNLLGALVAGLALAVILFTVAHKPLKPAQWITALVLFGIVLAIGLRYFSQTRAAAAEGIVQCLAGPIEIRSRGKSGFYLSVTGQSFRLPIRPWNVKSGAAYRVYIAPKTRTIVGIEPQ